MRISRAASLQRRPDHNPTNMTPDITAEELYTWCSIPCDQLETHPLRKVPFRLVRDSQQMGIVMARELADEIKKNNAGNKSTRAIIPCGPACWYAPFTALINEEKISLKNFVVFHMDECLDWQGRELPKKHPYNFRGFMEEWFYGPVSPELTVLEESRMWLTPQTIEQVRERIWAAPIDITYGGWGQDGHIAYNQARRHPFSHVSLEDVRNSTVRIQDNNIDTVLALAQRTF